MADRRPSWGDFERTVLEVDSVRHSQLSAILSFVEGIHYHIDPDFFRIRPEDLQMMKVLLGGDAFYTRATLSV